MKYLLPIAVLLAPLCATGGQTSYFCTTLQILELSSSGKMEKHNGIYTQLIGKQFAINRSSGEMIGLPFSTESYAEITVLDKGSKDNAFKAIVTSHPPNIWVKYIHVGEYHLGKKKPFWGTDDGNKIFSGVCE